MGWALGLLKKEKESEHQRPSLSSWLRHNMNTFLPPGFPPQHFSSTGTHEGEVCWVLLCRQQKTALRTDTSLVVWSKLFSRPTRGMEMLYYLNRTCLLVADGHRSPTSSNWYFSGCWHNWLIQLQEACGCLACVNLLTDHQRKVPKPACFLTEESPCNPHMPTTTTYLLPHLKSFWCSWWQLGASFQLTLVKQNPPRGHEHRSWLASELNLMFTPHWGYFFKCTVGFFFYWTLQPIFTKTS